jgi:PhnB protein
MVDALRRAHRLVDPNGFVVDLHPSAARALVKVGDTQTGVVDAGDGPLRHAGAGVALAAVVDEGLFAIDRTLVFRFNTYADTIDELRDYLAAHWREGRIAEDTVERTRQAASQHPGSRPHVTERVHATRLRPLTRVDRPSPGSTNPRRTTMQMHTYVNFKGRCAEAFRFYEQHLGGKIEMMMTHGEAPPEVKVDPAWKDAVLHARISLGGTVLLGADVPRAEPMRSAYLTLIVDSDAEAERIHAVLSDGGAVLMPIQETFFATRFAQVRDPFGINWMILRPRPMAAPAS